MSASRLLFLDNLRSFVIILVVSMHAADTYSPLGNWYFQDREPLSKATLLFFAVWQTYLQAFFMGLLFFIAGYFVPSSLARKGRAAFLKERAFRLGWPVLLYMFVIGPLTEYFVAHSWMSTVPTTFMAEWLKHIRNGQFLQENGPLWFCLALLLFSLIYAAAAWPLPCLREIRLGQLTGLALTIATATFLIRGVNPHPIFNLPLKDFGQYVILFAAGTLCSGGHVLTGLRPKLGRQLLAAAFSAGLLAWFALLVFGGALNGHANRYQAGWHWQNAAFSLWESFTCVAISYGLLTFFAERFDHQGSFAKLLSANAFGVYVFHPPVVIAVARLLKETGAPPAAKFVLLTALATAATFALSALLLRRLPLLRRIL